MHFFDELQPRVMTRIDLPLIDRQTDQVEVYMRVPKRLPFPCVMVVQPYRGTDEVERSLFTVYAIFEQRDDGITYAGKMEIRHPKVSQTEYMPENAPFDDGKPEHDDCVAALARFGHLVERREHRYLEEPISRQQRRALGVSRDYRHYIVVDRECVEYERATPIASIVPTPMVLHTVRGHLRHYKSGLTVPVRPHTRGKGEAVQVKDYRILS